MHVENRLLPEADQIAALQEPGPAGPIVMVNLLKYRARAAYPDGSDAHLSGREAYKRYAVAVEKVLRGVGGRILYSGSVTFLTVGRMDPLWDDVALAEYPNRAAMLKMAFSPEYQAIAHHREAGLEGQLNIETVSNLAEILGSNLGAGA